MVAFSSASNSSARVWPIGCGSLNGVSEALTPENSSDRRSYYHYCDCCYHTTIATTDATRLKLVTTCYCWPIGCGSLNGASEALTPENSSDRRSYDHHCNMKFIKL